MNKDPRESITNGTEELTETPVFTRFKEWWRAKKESLDLWGLGKYFGFDNTQLKSALSSYKSLLTEIEHEYDAVAKSSGATPDQIEEAGQRREQMLLDAKRDLVYQMPENYRIWFKKRKIFNSWRTRPENWGFEESRYWGGRSGLTMRERRVLFGTLLIVFAGFGYWLYSIWTYEAPPEYVDETKFNVEKSTENVDSLYQAKRLAELKAAEEQKRRKQYAEARNRTINDINAGVYTTNSKDMRSEVKSLMQIYYENVYKQGLSEDEISTAMLRSALLLIGKKNPGVVTARDTYGVPLEWKPNTRINLTWVEVNSQGLDAYYKRKTGR